MNMMYIFQMFLLVLFFVCGAALLWMLFVNSDPVLRTRPPSFWGRRSYPSNFTLTFGMVILIILMIVDLALLKLTQFDKCSFLSYWWPALLPFYSCV